MRVLPFPDRPFSAANRIDPYYQGFWDGGGTGVSWTSISQARAQQRTGLGRIPKPWSMSTEDAIAVVENPRNRRQIISCLGALLQWQNLTSEQLSDISGYKSFAASFEDRAHSSKVILALFTLGFIEYGVATTGVWETQRRNAPKMYRVSARTKRFSKMMSRDFSWAEQLAVTAGLPIVSGRNAGRHNVLASELGLRSADLPSVAAVFGERLCGVDALNYASAGMEPTNPQTGFADLCVIRSDGLKIVFEVTASGSPGMATKAMRWAQTLSQTYVENTGVVVVFLEAYPNHRPKSGATDTWAKTCKAVRTATRLRYPGPPGHPTSKRMFVARWKDWFPSAHSFSDSFMRFSCLGATGPDLNDPDTIWEPTHLLDPKFGYKFAPTEPEQMLAPITLASTLAGTPASMRQPVPEFYKKLNEIAAASRGLPPSIGAAPLRERSQFRRADEMGAASEPTLAKRLTWG